MGYKIEIVLISIAVFLCGVIILGIAFTPNVPTVITPNETLAFDESKNNANNNVTNVVNSAQGDKININNASKSELMELKGVGEVIAQRIIDYRNNKPFTSVDEIVEVAGIGEKRFQDIKDYITVK